MLSAYVHGSAAPVDRQPPEDLAATVQIHDWLRGLLPNLPDEAQLRARVDYEALLRPFRQLADEHFRGRQRELDRLRDYVEVFEASTTLESVWRGTRNVFGLHQKNPLMIHGPGGIGKSTLLSRFLLEHLDQPGPAPIAFAYLDLDRQKLAPEEPLTLLAEIARQLGLQFPDSRRSLERFRETCLETLQSGKTRRDEAAHGKVMRVAAKSVDAKARYALLGRFADESAAQDRPFVLILDTFEQVQRRSSEFVRTVWDFLEQLQKFLPRLRTVLVGRQKVTQFPVDEVSLGQLDREAGLQYMESRGLADPETAAAIFDQVGGSPLNLRLAANLALKEGADHRGLRNLETRRLWLIRLDDELIRGRLYRRMLDHIENDDEVKRLAHPGLVLRRVTPDVIRHVMGPLCGVAVPGDAAAQDLFERFSRQVDLVVPGEDGSLQHRPDIRADMLRLLRADDLAKVQAITRAAIDYYSKFDDPASRAEEIYHRLALGGGLEAVDGRWIEGIESRLVDAVDELPTESQAYLASRVGIELDSEVWRKADLKSWERQAAQRIRDLIGIGDLEQAVAVAAQRPDRSSGSPVLDAEVELYRRLGDYSRAHKAALAGAEGPDPLPFLVRAAALEAEMGPEIGNAPTPDEIARDYDLLANRFPDRAPDLLAIGLSRVKVMPTDSPATFAVRKRMASIVAAQPDQAIYAGETLYRQVMIAIGAADPTQVNRILRTAGLDLGVVEALLPKLDHFASIAHIDLPPTERDALSVLERFFRSADLSPAAIAELCRVLSLNTLAEM
ncbi:MAG: AAA family ATPase [Bryobacteraceae bacterium]